MQGEIIDSYGPSEWAGLSLGTIYIFCLIYTEDRMWLLIERIYIFIRTFWQAPVITEPILMLVVPLLTGHRVCHEKISKSRSKWDIIYNWSLHNYYIWSHFQWRSHLWSYGDRMCLFVSVAINHFKCILGYFKCLHIAP